MNFPSELKYTKDHEWLRIDGDDAFIGITVYVDITSVGQEVAKEEVFGTVEAVKTVSDLFMPATGNILELNPKLDKEPELVNTDPYGDGWMVRVRLQNASDVDGLLSADEYQAIIGA